MSATFNFNDLKKVQLNITKVQENQEEILRMAVSEIAQRVLALAKKNTPVGVYDQPVNFVTKEGEEVSFKPNTGKKGGTLRRGWTIGKIVREGKNYKIEVRNNTDYAHFVEYGHRLVSNGVTVGWVEGKFMMTIAEKEVEKQMERIVKRIVNRQLKGIFK